MNRVETGKQKGLQERKKLFFSFVSPPASILAERLLPHTLYMSYDANSIGPPCKGQGVSNFSRTDDI